MRDAIEAGRPYLGLCLGLQLLFEESDEHGVTPGFGLLAGRVERFPAPGHAGRARARAAHRLERGALLGRSRAHAAAARASDSFYFVHSYRAVPRDAAIVAGVVDYGAPFAAAVAHRERVRGAVPPGEEPGRRAAAARRIPRLDRGVRRALALALARVGALACAGPIVEDEVHDVDPKTLARIAVVPFLPSRAISAASGEPGRRERRRGAPRRPRS